MNYNKFIDHTALKADTQKAVITKLCQEAKDYDFASVCVNPTWVSYCADYLQDCDVKVCTVIGFPLGANTPEVKAFEAKNAIEHGADEVDMVINLGDVKNGEFDKITDEIAAVKKAAGNKILKVIIETCYLTENEKVSLCRCVTDGGADYIKTSTGFGDAGADINDIELFKKHIGPNVKIKAAGGIRTKEAMEEFINAGCERIGTSGAKNLIN